MIKYILWDIDGTVLNFDAAERAAIRKGFENFKLGECTDEMLKDYSSINKVYWQRLERGEMTKSEILVGRFKEFFAKYGIDVSKADAFNSAYQIDLGDTICFNDDAYNLICNLQNKYKQFAASNGTKVAQQKKLTLSGLNEIFEACFISDEIGFEKPSVEFFTKAFDTIEKLYGSFSKDEIIIIGDSLTSDIRGGNNAGIKTCWYNPFHVKNDLGVTVDVEIDNLRKIPEILEVM